MPHPLLVTSFVHLDSAWTRLRTRSRRYTSMSRGFFLASMAVPSGSMWISCPDMAKPQYEKAEKLLLKYQTKFETKFKTKVIEAKFPEGMREISRSSRVPSCPVSMSQIVTRCPQGAASDSSVEALLQLFNNGALDVNIANLSLEQLMKCVGKHCEQLSKSCTNLRHFILKLRTMCITLEKDDDFAAAVQWISEG